MPQKNITPAQEWRRDYEEGIEVIMPHNGRAVRIKSISIQFLLRTGKIPDSLTALALGAVDLTIGPDTAPESLREMEMKLDAYYRVICEEALVYPHVVEKPLKPDEIAYDWLTQHDKMFIERIIQLPVNDWRLFRLPADGNVESVPNGTAKSLPGAGSTTD